MGTNPLVELAHISKSFGPVKANNDIGLRVYAGEIHAILGENGCGKSTLMNILSGLYAPDSGSISIDGRPIVLANPKDAIDKGIGMIHQHFKLVEALTAWENVIGGAKRGIFLSRKAVVGQINELCNRYGLRLDPLKRVCDMTIGEKQTVEIVKALYANVRILILDEPTAVLTVQETRRLFDILREMKQKGHAVIIITHKLNEVMEVSDTITVLRRGENVCTVRTADMNPAKLAELMVGRKIDISVPFADTSDSDRHTVLEINDLTIRLPNGNVKLDIPHLDVKSGEIVGVAGVADSGQRELCEAVTGMMKARGSVKLHGRELNGMNPRSMLHEDIQIGFIPEDRLGMGLAGGMNITQNAVLRAYNQKKGLFMDAHAGRALAEKLVADYNVSAPRLDVPVRTLSGGNIQKILLGREINRGADLLIAAYPVRGLDIGATDYIYGRLNEEKKAGKAILLVAEDLDTLLGLCDRIAVLHMGKLMAVVDRAAASKEQIGLWMTGMKEDEHDQN